MASNSKINSRSNNVDSTVIQGVFSIMERNSDTLWTGTMTDLNAALARVLGSRKSQILPGSPGALRVVLDRVVNRIRSRGIGVRFGRTSDHSRTRFVRFAQ